MVTCQFQGARLLGLSALCALLALAALPSAHAASAVFSGDGSGQTDFFESAQTGAGFYGRRNHAPFPVAPNGLYFFFHVNETTGELSLGISVDARGDGSGGRLTGTISGLGSAAFVALSDDNGEVRMSAPGTAVFSFRFAGCCTDGAIISGLDPANLNLSIAIARATGLTGAYLAGPGGATSLGGAPFSGAVYSVVTSAPEPDAWALFILGFAGVAASLKHARKKKRALPVRALSAATP